MISRIKSMKIIWFAISMTACQASHTASSPVRDQHLLIQTKGPGLSFKQKGAAGGSGEQLAMRSLSIPPLTLI